MLFTLLLGGLTPNANAQSDADGPDLAWHDDLEAFLNVYKRAPRQSNSSAEIDGPLWAAFTDSEGRPLAEPWELTAWAATADDPDQLESILVEGRRPRVEAAGPGFVVLGERASATGGEVFVQYVRVDGGPNVAPEDQQGDLIALASTNYQSSPGADSFSRSVDASIASNGAGWMLAVWQDDAQSNFGRRERRIYAQFLSFDPTTYPYLATVDAPFVVNDSVIPQHGDFRFGFGPSVAAGVSPKDLTSPEEWEGEREALLSHFAVAWVEGEFDFNPTPPDVGLQGLGSRVMSRVVSFDPQTGVTRGPVVQHAQMPTIVDIDEGADMFIEQQYLATDLSRAPSSVYDQDYLLTWSSYRVYSWGTGVPVLPAQGTCLTIDDPGTGLQLVPDTLSTGGRAGIVHLGSAGTRTWNTSLAPFGLSGVAWQPSDLGVQWVTIDHADCSTLGRGLVKGEVVKPGFQARPGYAGPGNPLIVVRPGLDPSSLETEVQSHLLRLHGPGYLFPAAQDQVVPVSNP